MKKQTLAVATPSSSSPSSRRSPETNRTPFSSTFFPVREGQGSPSGSSITEGQNSPSSSFTIPAGMPHAQVTDFMVAQAGRLVDASSPRPNNASNRDTPSELHFENSENKNVTNLDDQIAADTHQISSTEQDEDVTIVVEPLTTKEEDEEERIKEGNELAAHAQVSSVYGESSLSNTSAEESKIPTFDTSDAGPSESHTSPTLEKKDQDEDDIQNMDDQTEEERKILNVGRCDSSTEHSAPQQPKKRDKGKGKAPAEDSRLSQENLELNALLNNKKLLKRFLNPTELTEVESYHNTPITVPSSSEASSSDSHTNILKDFSPEELFQIAKALHEIKSQQQGQEPFDLFEQVSAIVDPSLRTKFSYYGKKFITKFLFALLALNAGYVYYELSSGLSKIEAIKKFIEWLSFVANFVVVFVQLCDAEDKYPDMLRGIYNSIFGKSPTHANLRKISYPRFETTTSIGITIAAYILALVSIIRNSGTAYLALDDNEANGLGPTLSIISLWFNCIVLGMSYFVISTLSVLPVSDKLFTRTVEDDESVGLSRKVTAAVSTIDKGTNSSNETLKKFKIAIVGSNLSVYFPNLNSMNYSEFLSHFKDLGNEEKSVWIRQFALNEGIELDSPEKERKIREGVSWITSILMTISASTAFYVIYHVLHQLIYGKSDHSKSYPLLVPPLLGTPPVIYFFIGSKEWALNAFRFLSENLQWLENQTGISKSFWPAGIAILAGLGFASSLSSFKVGLEAQEGYLSFVSNATCGWHEGLDCRIYPAIVGAGSLAVNGGSMFKLASRFITWLSGDTITSELSTFTTKLESNYCMKTLDYKTIFEAVQLIGNHKELYTDLLQVALGKELISEELIANLENQGHYPHFVELLENNDIARLARLLLLGELHTLSLKYRNEYKTLHNLVNHEYYNDIFRIYDYFKKNKAGQITALTKHDLDNIGPVKMSKSDQMKASEILLGLPKLFKLLGENESILLECLNTKDLEDLKDIMELRSNLLTRKEFINHIRNTYENCGARSFFRNGPKHDEENPRPRKKQASETTPLLSNTINTNVPRDLPADLEPRRMCTIL